MQAKGGLSVLGRVVTAFITLLLLASCSGSTHSESKAHDIVLEEFPEAKEEILEAFRALAEASRNHDADGQRRAHLDSPKFSAFGSDKPTVKDFAEKMEQEVSFFSSLHDLKLEWEDDLKLSVFDDAAVAAFLLSFTALDANGERVEVSGLRATLVLVKTTDGWKIVHEHVS